MNKSSTLVLYHHGKDSTPWGEKTAAFAAVAEQLGCAFESIDYRGLLDPDARVQHLLTQDFSAYTDIVCVGSSMGAYVATVAAPILKPRGLFLLAPAFYLPGYHETQFAPSAADTWVFHGWQDTVVPPANAWHFCEQYRTRLTLLDADHRLMSHLPYLAAEFKQFLAERLPD